jgi:type II secretory pathway pseudopilin PulG
VSDESLRSQNDRRTKTIEIIEIVVLSIVAMVTAWSGYQGTKWGGRQSELYAQASSIRLQADELGTRAGQVLVADATIFTAWLQARHADDRSLQTQLERRFSPDYAIAFHRWLATDPFDDPNAPAGPAAMPGFTTADLTQAAQMNAEASALLTEGSDARDTANEYIRATVLFASVLLLIGIAQRFSVHGVRIAANVLALVLLSYAVWSVVRLPRM